MNKFHVFSHSAYHHEEDASEMATDIHVITHNMHKYYHPI